MNIYQAALDCWGKKLQIAMLAEECSELSAAALHLNRGRDAREEVAEEAADVEIMLAQLREIMGEDIDRWKRKKLARLKQTLDRANDNWKVSPQDVEELQFCIDRVRYACKCGQTVRVGMPGHSGEFGDNVLEIACPVCGARMRPIIPDQPEKGL